MASEASVAVDETLADIQILLIHRHVLQLGTRLDIGRIVAEQFESDIIERCGINLRKRLFLPLRVFQRRQIRGNVGCLFIRQPQARHLRFRPDLRRVLHPVEKPGLRDFAALVFQVVSVAPADLALIDFLDRADRMAAETSDCFHDLFARLGIAVCTARRQFFRFGIGPEIFHDGIDFGRIALVPINTVRFPAVIAVVPELRHAGL